MRSVKMLTDFLDPHRAATDRWYVTNGVTSVGPVNTDLLARGIEAGKVPIESFVRHEAWKVWRPLSDIAVVTSDSLPPTSVAAVASARVASPASDAVTIPGGLRALTDGTCLEGLSAPIPDPTFPGYPAVPWPSSTEGGVEPPCATSDDDLTHSDVTLPGRAPFAADSPFASRELDFPQLTRPALLPESSTAAAASDASQAAFGLHDDGNGGPVSFGFFPPEPSAPLPASPEPPAGPRFDDCKDLSGALLMLLSFAVEGSSADAAIVHQVHDDGAVAVCAHGPRMAEILGQTMPLIDPALAAAASGLCVVAEPSPGPAGQAILARLAALGSSAGGAVMIPIRPRGRLFATLEMGRRAPFLPSEIAAACELVERLADRIEAAGWA
jgi:hypothetical protein